MNIGPLGFPRLTSVGPLVGGDIESFSQAVEKEELNGVITNAATDQGFSTDELDGKLEIEESDELDIIEDVASQVYPDTGPVNNAKRARLAVCMRNEWARKWADGLAESTRSANPNNDIEMILLKFKGCIGLTESNVPDDVRLIPDRFK